jgi:hypothetical protein
MKSDEMESTHSESFLKRNCIALGAASISIVGSAAYACMLASMASLSWYSVFRQISLIGSPGLVFGSLLTSLLQIVPPRTAFLPVATLVNFFFYLGLGLGP